MATEINQKNENDNSENESSIAVEAAEATHENNHIDVVENEVENIENSEKTCEAHVQRDNIEVENDDEVIVKLHSNLQTQLNFSWFEQELTLFSHRTTRRTTHTQLLPRGLTLHV